GVTEHQLPTRRLGNQGLVVSAVGLGCMGMSQAYGLADEEESLATLDRALELGVFFLDTADAYGDGHNERLVGRAIQGRRDRFVVATKFGVVKDGPMAGGVSGRPEYVRSCCEASLLRLNTDHIDLYYQHRVDPEVPIEDTVGAMAGLVQAGQVRFLGLSEASADSLERAAAVHPISALQSEWSLWTRDLEDDILGTARRLGIGLVPYSPLGRGFLTGKITDPQDFGPDDFRRENPRFQGENFERNRELVRLLEQLAAEHGVTPAQLALAWLLGQGPDVVPIPGTKRRANLEENSGAAWVTLTDSDLVRLSGLVPPGAFAGTRYADSQYAYGSSPART
ncbi:MAG TPA: aldo/keto reductase, partial [Candidatus Acidoferrales bacterium]|nr:aldo/keto reductase [Candidatus Acidoferrales bacterium]